MQITSDPKLPLPFILLTVVYVWHTAVPYVGVNMPAAINTLILVLLFLFMGSDKSFSIRKAMFAIAPLYFLSILGFASYSSSQWPAQMYGLIQRIAFPLIAFYIMQNRSTQSKRNVLLLVLIGYAVTCVTTYLGCLSYPGAARQMATGMSEEGYLFNMYRQLNIGSFAFVYTLVLLLPIVLYVIRGQQKFWILFILFGIAAVMAIIEMEYTTALLLMLINFLLFFLPRYFNANDLKDKLWIFVVAGILVWFVLPSILDAIIPYVSSDTMSSRLLDLSASLKGDVAQSQDGDMESRSELFMVSIKGFLSSPIWGTFTKAGGHSFLLDTMSKYGLIGLGLLIVMYKRAYTLFIKPYKSQPYFGYVLFAFIMTLVLAVLNPKDNLLVLTFLIPLFCESYSNETNKI